MSKSSEGRIDDIHHPHHHQHHPQTYLALASAIITLEIASCLELPVSTWGGVVRERWITGVHHDRRRRDLDEVACLRR